MKYIRYRSETDLIFLVRRSGPSEYCIRAETEDHRNDQIACAGYGSREAAQSELERHARARGWAPEEYVIFTIV